MIERELQAREALVQQARDKLEDAVCRAVGLLAMARRIDSLEAVALLSRIRLGIGQQWGIRLDHPQLSRLFVDIQPSHLQSRLDVGPTPDARDLARASLLRTKFLVDGGKEMNN